MVHVSGLEDYCIPKPESEFRLGSDDSDYDQYDQGETHSDDSTSDEDTD